LIFERIASICGWIDKKMKVKHRWRVPIPLERYNDLKFNGCYSVLSVTMCRTGRDACKSAKSHLNLLSTIVKSDFEET
jgi:hypothetical protein